MSETSTAQTDPFAEEAVADLIEWLDLGEGDEWQAAARSIYVRYYEWLFRRLYKSLKDSGYLEEIVLKTFRKAICSISKFQRTYSHVVLVSDSTPCGSGFDYLKFTE